MRLFFLSSRQAAKELAFREAGARVLVQGAHVRPELTPIFLLRFGELGQVLVVTEAGQVRDRLPLLQAVAHSEEVGRPGLVGLAEEPLQRRSGLLLLLLGSGLV